MRSKNMNYIFNVEYFEGYHHLNADMEEDDENGYENRNKEISHFAFEPFGGFAEFQTLEGYESFELYTAYPGLLVGTGNPHTIAIKNAIKCGFSFDYVTGLPYVPGSSLKGVLRSYFPKKAKENGYNEQMDSEKETLIRKFLGGTAIDILRFRNHIFENNDVFLFAVPIIKERPYILADDFITPHKESLKNPVPINIIKIVPDVCIRFCFILSDYCDDNGTVLVSKLDKIELFKKLLLLGGLGAKTNVGFGRLVDKETDEERANRLREKANRLKARMEIGNTFQARVTNPSRTKVDFTLVEKT